MRWYSGNNCLALSTSKTKELNTDFRKGVGGHTPLFINGHMVDRVSSFDFLNVHMSEDVSWTANTTALIKKAQLFIKITKENKPE